MPELVQYSVQDDVAILSIHNPPVNALSPGVPEGIDAGVVRAGADPAVKAVVLVRPDESAWLHVRKGKGSAQNGP